MTMMLSAAICSCLPNYVQALFADRRFNYSTIMTNAEAQGLQKRLPDKSTKDRAFYLMVRANGICWLQSPGARELILDDRLIDMLENIDQ
jgi:hypothetical protein